MDPTNLRRRHTVLDEHETVHRIDLFVGSIYEVKNIGG
jgi:hypothetical protein